MDQFLKAIIINPGVPFPFDLELKEKADMIVIIEGWVVFVFFKGGACSKDVYYNILIQSKLWNNTLSQFSPSWSLSTCKISILGIPQLA